MYMHLILYNPIVTLCNVDLPRFFRFSSMKFWLSYRCFSTLQIIRDSLPNEVQPRLGAGQDPGQYYYKCLETDRKRLMFDDFCRCCIMLLNKYDD